MFLGIIKPTAILLSDDIAYAPQEKRGYIKASDKSGFDSNALWIQYSFSKLVHPFSNSISGTFLSFLKHLALFKNSQTISLSKEKIEDLSKVLICILQLCTGGHSLFEYIYPIQLQAVQDEFADIKNFSELTLEKIFLSNNEPAFSFALERTIEYMNTIPISHETILEHNDLVITEEDYTKITQRKERLDYYLSSLNRTIKDLEELLRINKVRVDSEYLGFLRRGIDLHDDIKRMTNSMIAQLKIEKIEEAIMLANKLIDYTVEEDVEKSYFNSSPQAYTLAVEIHKKIIDFRNAQIDFEKRQNSNPQLSFKVTGASRYSVFFGPELTEKEMELRDEGNRLINIIWRNEPIIEQAAERKKLNSKRHLELDTYVQSLRKCLDDKKSNSLLSIGKKML